MLFIVITTLKCYFASQLFSFEKLFVVDESTFYRFAQDMKFILSGYMCFDNAVHII